MNAGIYRIRNRVNGRIYIGSAVNLRARFNGHLGHLNRGSHHNAHLQSAWRKYGADAFEIRPLLFCGKDDLYFYEQRCLDAFGVVTNGYNKSPSAGTSRGVKRSAEFIAKMAATKRGKKWSAERRAERIALWASQEMRARISAASKAAVRPPKTPEHIRKIALANCGKILSPETRAKLRAFNLGLKHGPHSEETRRKISLAQKGRTFSPEHIARLSAAQRRRFAREAGWQAARGGS